MSCGEFFIKGAGAKIITTNGNVVSCFKSRDERERTLFKNFAQVGQDVKAMIADISNRKNAK